MKPADDLFWRDEILQIMYWLRGEGLGETVSASDLTKFLDADEPFVKRYLNQLITDGYAVQVEGFPTHYQLTADGIEEGGRRFAEEFSELTHQGHGECNDPKCACKTLGPQACVHNAPHQHH